jgi:hypothetical protein
MYLYMYSPTRKTEFPICVFTLVLKLSLHSKICRHTCRPGQRCGANRHLAIYIQESKNSFLYLTCAHFEPLAAPESLLFSVSHLVQAIRKLYPNFQNFTNPLHKTTRKHDYGPGVSISQKKNTLFWVRHQSQEHYLYVNKVYKENSAEPWQDVHIIIVLQIIPGTVLLYLPFSVEVASVIIICLPQPAAFL